MRKVIEVPTDVFLEMCDRISWSPPDTNELSEKVIRLQELARLPRLCIGGRRWFRSSTGNTYHKVYIYADGHLLAALGPTYGYGDSYLTMAFDWLLENRPAFVPGFVKGKTNPTIYLREVIGGTYSVSDVNREREL